MTSFLKSSHEIFNLHASVCMPVRVCDYLSWRVRTNSVSAIPLYEVVTKGNVRVGLESLWA